MTQCPTGSADFFPPAHPWWLPVVTQGVWQTGGETLTLWGEQLPVSPSLPCGVEGWGWEEYLPRPGSSSLLCAPVGTRWHGGASGVTALACLIPTPF